MAVPSSIIRFPQDGEYEIEVLLTRDRNEHVEGLKETHEMEILLDRSLVKQFTIDPPKGTRDHSQVDKHLKTRFSVKGRPEETGGNVFTDSVLAIGN